MVADIEEIGVYCEEGVWNGIICIEYDLLGDAVWARSFAFDLGGAGALEFSLGQIGPVPFCGSVIGPIRFRSIRGKRE